MTQNIGSKYNDLLNRNKNFMNNIALSFGDRKITYEELHENILNYAKALYKKGIRENDLVAVCLENNPESVYLVYALDIIGARRVGLSIFNNQYKMKRDIDQIKPQRIITTTSSFNFIKDPSRALEISPILYDPIDFSKKFDNYESLNEIIEMGKDSDLKYGNVTESSTTDIIFTGGSSGIHKGVELNGFGLAEMAKSVDNVFCLEPGMKHLGNIPFGHMVFGMFALHYSLSHNLEYALTLKSLPNDFLEEILRTRANGIMGGPVHFDNLHNNPLLTKGCLSSVLQASTGGEKLKSKTFENTMNAFSYGNSSAVLIDMLGLTEMYGLTHACVPGKNSIGTIGNSIPCIEDKVVSIDNLKNSETGKRIKLVEVPIGENGVLLTHGKAMMLRYFNNPEETRKVFVYDENGKKWYNTGDLVCRTGNNPKEVKFSGRLKRNFVSDYDNIYPEQVEELLLNIPEIIEACVTKIADDRYQYLPVYHLYTIDNVNYNELEDKINNLIESTLGINALPGYIEYYHEPLPKTDNNKLNANLLEQQFIEKMKDQQIQKANRRIRNI